MLVHWLAYNNVEAKQGQKIMFDTSLLDADKSKEC
jgi:hypothetical protein